MTSRDLINSKQIKEPLVSVVMNCYNGEKYLREAIDSVYAQTYSNWEIIFWDNLSTDATQKIATSYDSRLKYFRAEINTHLGPARNMALKRTTGFYIAFLDSDDLFLPLALQRQVDLMESDDYGLVYAGTIDVNEKGKVIGRRKVKYSSGYIFENLLRRYEISMCSVMISQSVIVEEGLGFDESLEYCPDYNLFMKIAAQYRIGVIQDYIVKYRHTSDSLSRKTLHLAASENRQTLDELQKMYPDVVRSCGELLVEARAKLNFYDAVNYINMSAYGKARSVLKPVIRYHWQFLIIYWLLFLPIPKNWMLRALKR